MAAGKRVFTHRSPGRVRSAAFSADGSEAFVLAEYGDGCGVFRADFRDGSWRELFKLPFGYGLHVEGNGEIDDSLALRVAARSEHSGTEGLRRTNAIA